MSLLQKKKIVPIFIERVFFKKKERTWKTEGFFKTRQKKAARQLTISINPQVLICFNLTLKFPLELGCSEGFHAEEACLSSRVWSDTNISGAHRLFPQMECAVAERHRLDWWLTPPSWHWSRRGLKPRCDNYSIEELGYFFILSLLNWISTPTVYLWREDRPKLFSVEEC